MKRLMILGLAAALSGCGTQLRNDNAILTLPVPNPATDCQIRFTTANFDGAGPGVSGGMQSQITTAIGVGNCPPGMLIQAPSLQRLTVEPSSERPSLIDRVDARLTALCAQARSQGLDPPECEGIP